MTSTPSQVKGSSAPSAEPADPATRPSMSMFASAADYNAAMDEWLAPTHTDPRALVEAVEDHLTGWKSATFGWQDDADPVVAERNKRAAVQAHAAECIRRIRETLAAGIQPTPEQGEAVAVRYWNSSGRWRYLNYPFTKGWDFPPGLGKLVYLYEGPPAGIQGDGKRESGDGGGRAVRCTFCCDLGCPQCTDGVKGCSE